MENRNGNFKPIVKSYNSNLKCHRARNHTGQHNQEKRKSNDLIFVALDSCIIIDMMKVLNGDPKIKNDPEYYNGIKRILDLSALNSSGNRNPNGRFVLCVPPTVRRELSNEDGKFFDRVKEIVDKRTISLAPDAKYIDAYSKKRNKIIKSYLKRGYFLDKQKVPEIDAFIVAEPSMFNITLLSRDKHIVGSKQERNSKRKSETIKACNRKCMGENFNGNQAEPKSVKDFLYAYDKGFRFPQGTNLEILPKDTKEILEYNLNLRLEKANDKFEENTVNEDTNSNKTK